MLTSNPHITLSDLPPPPPGRTGFPWTEASPLLAESILPHIPRITISTPSYNQGQFIEETIRSVLLQGYPNLEYIVIDGGSTDDSIDIIQKYADFLTYWVSEPDRGQSDAINKGFTRSTGELMGWLNSDDYLAPGALFKLATHYKSGLHWWNGNALNLEPDGSLRGYPQLKQQITRNHLLHACTIITQVSTFWTRELWDKVGAVVSDIHLAMDYDLWLRFSQHVPATVLHDTLAIYRTHADAKTGSASGQMFYRLECDTLRRVEYDQLGLNILTRSILINFWTRSLLAELYSDWRSWIGRRKIPYV